MERIRRKRAASMVLVVAFILALAVIIVAAIALINLLGGGQQMQRATDAGNLSLARSVLVKVAVPIPNSGDAVQFNGVTDHTSGTNGVVNLRNINRVMAQSMIVNFNAHQISKDGLDQGATSHAASITLTAQSLGKQLSDQLAKPSSVEDFFSSIAKLNPTKQFGPQDISPLGAPTFSYLDRTGASNVYIAASAMPDYDFATKTSKTYNDKVSGWVTAVSSDVDPSGNHNYLKGYLEGMTPDTSFANTYFVPLKPGAKPHLVSQVDFDLNKKASSGANAFSWTQPVPNSLSLKAQAQSAQGYNGGFNACAIVEPIDPKGFAAALPHGFVRIQNGASSPATGVANGNKQDVFVYVMNNPQVYPVDVNGKALPYFVGVNDSPLPGGCSNGSDYVAKIAQDIKDGKTPDCSGLNVGVALSGDTLGFGGVSQANCNSIGGIGGANVDNIALDNASSKVNTDMALYHKPDSRNLWARPVIEAAYDIQPPTPISSGTASVNVADIVNLKLLSDRAEGNDFHPGTYQSGIAHVPASRGPLSSPNYRITTDQGVHLDSKSPEGITLNGTMWKYLTQRMYQIDPEWLSYANKGIYASENRPLDYILSQNIVPMGGRGYIYFSQSANAGKGGLVLKEESAALSDAPWLSSFIGQLPDAKSPTTPTETRQFELMPFSQINVAGDWNYPQPYDYPGKICLMNWFSFTPASGWNNLLGQLNMGAISTTCCPEGSTGSGAFGITYSGSGDTITIPNGCACPATTSCDSTGPC